MRWIHRARFYVKPNTPVARSTDRDDRSAAPPQLADPGWFGTVVVEAEGTNEGLADLQARVGDAVKLFAIKSLTGQRVSNESLRTPTHGGGAMAQQQQQQQGAVGGGGGGGKSAFRLLRAQSRPGEIWLRCVRDKERIL